MTRGAVATFFAHAPRETFYNCKIFYELEELVRRSLDGKHLWAAGAFIANAAETLTVEQYDELCDMWFQAARRLGVVSPSRLTEDRFFASSASKVVYTTLSEYRRDRVLRWVEGRS